MTRNLVQFEITFEISAIEVIRSKKEACCFCKFPQNWSLVVYFNHKPIRTFPCCASCYQKILAVLPRLRELIENKVWVSLYCGVPAYFKGDGFENDLRTLLGLPLLPRDDEEGVEPVKTDKGPEWEAEA